MHFMYFTKKKVKNVGTFFVSKHLHLQCVKHNGKNPPAAASNENKAKARPLSDR